MTPATQAAPKEHFAPIFLKLSKVQVPQEEVKFKAERLYSLVQTGRGCPDKELNDAEKRAHIINDFAITYLNYSCRPLKQRNVSELIESDFLSRLTPKPEALGEEVQKYLSDVVIKSLKGLPGYEDLDDKSPTADWLKTFFYYTLSEESLSKQMRLYQALNPAEYSLFTQQRTKLAQDLLPLYQSGVITKEQVDYFIKFLKENVINSTQKDSVPKKLYAQLQKELSSTAQSTFIMYLELIWYGNNQEKREIIRDNLSFTLTRFLITYS